MAENTIKSDPKISDNNGAKNTNSDKKNAKQFSNNKPKQK
jgi:hypothetical protein